ncbi:MAG: hypothetical protein CME65_09140 [Halobacteriovoraceae bacterium]|nr:hypothetical protein [Halobacteriovoraceae bacterium]
MKRRYGLSDLLTKLSDLPLYLLPLGTLIIGLLGSLHCMGMCGPLVLAFTRTKKQNFHYQGGRLTGYMFLALLFSTFGLGIKSALKSSFFLDFAIYSLAIFIFLYGINILLKGKFDFLKENKMGRLSSSIYSFLKPYIDESQFLVGALSIFLPCGLLYGLIAVVLVANNQFLALISIFTFWLGTLPGLVVAPQGLKKLAPILRLHSPKLSSATFMIIGLATIYFRYQTSIDSSCH